MVDAAEEEDTPKDADISKAADTSKAEASKVEEVAEDTIRGKVLVDEAKAMSNTTNKVAAMAAPLQPTRLDSQDGMDISM